MVTTTTKKSSVAGGENVADAIENYQRNRYAIPKGNLDSMRNNG